jgi:hypothetical protein
MVIDVFFWAATISGCPTLTHFIDDIFAEAKGIVH